MVQGGVALFATIVLGVVVAMRHDVRWLLALAWPCAIVVIYETARICAVSRRRKLWITISGALMSMVALLWLYSDLAPTTEQTTSVAADTSLPSALPPPGNAAAAKSGPPQELTLHNLFLDDFQTGSYKMILNRSTPLYKEGRNIGEFPFEIGFYGDFQAKSLFMSFYAPGSDYAFELMSWFSNAYKDYLYDAKKNIHIWTTSSGDQNPLLSDDLLFTKKVYIYYENILTSEQIRLLTDLFARMARRWNRAASITWSIERKSGRCCRLGLARWRRPRLPTQRPGTPLLPTRLIRRSRRCSLFS